MREAIILVFANKQDLPGGKTFLGRKETDNGLLSTVVPKFEWLLHKDEFRRVFNLQNGYSCLSSLGIFVVLKSFHLLILVLTVLY